MFGFEGDNAREKGIVLLTMCFALAMAMLDNTVVNVALPTIRNDLGAGFSQLQWIVDAYALAFASLLLTGGILGDRYGRKRMFLAGLTVFTVFSLACGLSTTPTQLIVARALQGIGGALLIPGTLSIITVTFPPHERAKALGLWAGVSGIALALGPTLGGYMVEHLGWESVFFLNVPIGIIAFLVAMSTVRESRSEEQRQLDIVGLILGTSALFFVTYGLIEANALGWSDIKIIASLRAVRRLDRRVPAVGAEEPARADAAAVLQDPRVLRGQHGGLLDLARHVRDVLLLDDLHADDPRVLAVPGGSRVPAADRHDHRDGPERREVRLDARFARTHDLRAVSGRRRADPARSPAHPHDAVLADVPDLPVHGPRHGRHDGADDRRGDEQRRPRACRARLRDDEYLPRGRRRARDRAARRHPRLADPHAFAPAITNSD